MPFNRKLILHTPVSDETLIEGFVEHCIRDRVSLVAVVGPDAMKIESLVDRLLIGDGSDSTRFFCTTAHQDEPFEDVLHMVRTFELDPGEPIQEVRL